MPKGSGRELSELYPDTQNTVRASFTLNDK